MAAAVELRTPTPPPPPALAQEMAATPCLGLLLNYSSSASAQAKYFPGFCTPRSHSDTEDNNNEVENDDDSDSDSDSDSESRPRRRRPAPRHRQTRRFFSSLHDQIRDSEENSENESAGLTQSPPIFVRPSSHNNLFSYQKLHSGPGILSPPRRHAVQKGTSEHESHKFQQRRLQMLQIQLLKQQQIQMQQLWLNGHGQQRRTPTPAESPPLQALPAAQTSENSVSSGGQVQHARLLEEAAKRAQLGVMLRDLDQLEM